MVARYGLKSTRYASVFLEHNLDPLLLRFLQTFLYLNNKTGQRCNYPTDHPWWQIATELSHIGYKGKFNLVSIAKLPIVRAENSVPKQRMDVFNYKTETLWYEKNEAIFHTRDVPIFYDGVGWNIRLPSLMPIKVKWTWQIKILFPDSAKMIINLSSLLIWVFQRNFYEFCILL